MIGIDIFGNQSHHLKSGAFAEMVSIAADMSEEDLKSRLVKESALRSGIQPQAKATRSTSQPAISSAWLIRPTRAQALWRRAAKEATSFSLIARREKRFG
jgi:hypothetical protein